MAKNLDIEIDAGNFLDSFRPELPPSPASPVPDNNGSGRKAETGRKHHGGRPPSSGRKGSGKEEAREAESPEEEYLRLFIRDATTAARSGKLTYVRQEYHDRIMKIIQVIGKNGLSLAGYIDHVLTHHFEQYEEAVKRLYKENYEDVF